MKKQLDQLAKVVAEIKSVIDNFLPEKREMIIFGEWTLKDILAHLSGWNLYTTTSIDRFLNHKSIEWGKGVNEFNKESVNARKNWPWEKVYDEFVSSSQSMVDQYNSIGTELWNLNIFPNKSYTPAKYLKIDIKHYQEHLVQIQQHL